MDAGWDTVTVSSVDGFVESVMPLAERGWLFRGHARTHGVLLPSIDWKPPGNLDRAAKLSLERQSIDVFRKAAKYFAHEGEQPAMDDDLIALMVLRHYGVPTRLLDWSRSPTVAAFFAAQTHWEKDGEIWTFDRERYQSEGQKQWVRWPETTANGTGRPEDFTPQLTAFLPELPKDYWFVCLFYLSPGFPRQLAQGGAFSMTANFAEDHAPHIARLMGDRTRHRRFVVPAGLKEELLGFLRERHGLWAGALYPDSAGAAQVASEVFARPPLSGRAPI